MKKILLDIVAIGAFFLIVGIFFYPTLLQNKLPIPSDTLVGLYHPWRDYYADTYPRGIPFKNFLITDPVRQQIPWRKITIDQWKAGHVPLWNPYNFSGTGLLANIQAGVFYPLNILFFLFDFSIAWTILIILEPLLGGLFLYAYLRHANASRLPSYFGAVAWAFSGFSIAWLTWGTMIHVVLWLPLILLAIDNILEHKNPKILWFLVFTFAMTTQFFAGHAQLSAYVLLISAIYVIWKALFHGLAKDTLYIWLGFVAFILIASIQWIPLLQSASASSRISDSQSWLAAGWLLPWSHLVQFLIPDFFGNPATLNYWGQWNYGEFIGYVGVAGLIFAFYAVLFLRSASVKFWSFVLGIALLFLLPTPVAKIPFLIGIPFLSSLQPTRLIMLVDFALVLLAVFGLEDWMHYEKKRSLLPVFLVGIVFIGLWAIVTIPALSSHDAPLAVNLVIAKRNMILPTAMYVLTLSIWVWVHFMKRSSILKKGAVIFFIGITAVDLFRFGWKFTPFTASAYFFPETKAITFLTSRKQPFRTMSVNKQIFPPNTASFYGIESIEGYDPIYDSRYEEFIAALSRGQPNISPPFGFNRIVTTENIDSPLMALLNVQYVLSLKDLERQFLNKVFQEGEVRIYENRRSLPRAFLVGGVIFETDKQKIIEDLYAKTFNPHLAAIIESPLQLQSAELNQNEKAEVQTYSARTNTMTIRATVVSERLLVISIPYDKRWNVSLDGTKVSTVRTDYILTGIVIPIGDHTIDVSYE